MTVSRLGSSDAASNTDSVTLPAAYVAEHVDLGYAVTAHRAQGITVDASHVVVTSATTRENLYVSMTRGRVSNIAYVALDHPDEVHVPPEPDDVTAHTVLHGVLRHSGAEPSAHQMILEEHEQWTSIAQLAAEYEPIAAAAQSSRWVDLVKSCGLSDVELDSVLGSDSFGPLTAELRRAEANGHDVDRLLPALAAQRSLEDANDVGAVLISRLQRAALRPRGRRLDRLRYIAGLIPAAEGRMTPEMSTALAQRQRLIESRAVALATHAVDAEETWLDAMGTPPTTHAARNRWMIEIGIVAAYRDRYRVDGPRTLGEYRTQAQKLDATRARQAIRRAQRIADQEHAHLNGGAQTVRAWSRAIG
jgi:hypothetical protein